MQPQLPPVEAGAAGLGHAPSPSGFLGGNLEVQAAQLISIVSLSVTSLRHHTHKRVHQHLISPVAHGLIPLFRSQGKAPLSELIPWVRGRKAGERGSLWRLPDRLITDFLMNEPWDCILSAESWLISGPWTQREGAKRQGGPWEVETSLELLSNLFDILHLTL